MAILVSAHNLKKTYGVRPLFDGITFTIEDGESVGLIGPNGAGKSTLLKLLASREAPDGGTLSMQRGLKVGYLEQTPLFEPDATVESTIREGAAAHFGPHAEDWESVALTQEIMSKLSLVDGEDLVETLSGGWKKRVALGRELARLGHGRAVCDPQPSRCGAVPDRRVWALTAR